MTMLTLICDIRSLTVFIAWFASVSHDPITKGYQTIVYHSIITLFEWLDAYAQIDSNNNGYARWRM